MFAKIALLILVIGGSGGGVLAMRQSRLQAAHELTEARLRMRQHDEQLDRLRAQIAAKTTPASVHAMLARRAKLAGRLVPAVEVRTTLDARPDPEAGAGRVPADDVPTEIWVSSP